MLDICIIFKAAVIKSNTVRAYSFDEINFPALFNVRVRAYKVNRGTTKLKPKIPNSNRHRFSPYSMNIMLSGQVMKI